MAETTSGAAKPSHETKTADKIAARRAALIEGEESGLSDMTLEQIWAKARAGHIGTNTRKPTSK